MTDRIHVTMNIDLFVEDEKAMRDAAFERMREAWSSADDFPFESAGDVPLGQVVHSLLADALPAELAGCRRSQLEVDSDDSDDSENGTAGSTASDTSEGDTDTGDEDDGSDDSESGTEDESGTKDESDDNEPATKDESDDNESGDDDASSRTDDKTDS